jgi:hypothetical protein
MFVSFEADGSTGSSGGRNYTADSTVTHGTRFTLFVDTLVGASCSISEPGHGQLAGTGVAPASTPSFIFRWGRSGTNPNYIYWAAGTYTVTASCTLNSVTKTATHSVVIS